MDFFNHIEQFRKNLNENDEHILDYIFEHKDRIKNLTVREIAIANFTVPNSIIRICKKLGFSGYIEFRESLHQAIYQQNSFLQMTSLDEQIIKTKQLINEDILQQVIEKIHTSHKILIFAVGLSRHIAADFHQRLSIVGKNAHVFIDPHVMKYNAKTLSSKDLVFAISVSGTTKTVIDATTIAKTTGASTVSITGFSNNPLAKLTEFQFYGMCSEICIDNMDLTDRLSLSYITNHLFSEYIQQYLLPPKS